MKGIYKVGKKKNRKKNETCNYFLSGSWGEWAESVYFGLCGSKSVQDKRVIAA